MRVPKVKPPKMGKAASPPKGHGASVRPRLHTASHLKIGGKSAFPTPPAAFGPQDPTGGGAPAFGPAPGAAMAGPPTGAAPGDMGQ